MKTDVNSKETGVNPAIAYKIVMDMLKEKMGDEITDNNRQAWLTWDYLYKISLNECTHKDIDGESSIVRPFEDLGIDYKMCLYCSGN